MFCDNDLKKQKEGFLGQRVISEQDLYKRKDEYFVIVASSQYASAIYGDLLLGG